MMPLEIQRLMIYLEFVVVASAIGATLVPALYLFAPWWKSRLGRLFMLQAVAIALAVDLTALFHFWQPSSLIVAFWISLLVFTLLAIATFGLAWKIVKYDYRPYFKKEGSTLMTETATTPDKAMKTNPLLTNRSYNALKGIALLVLPALGVFYYGLAEIWNLPYKAEVAGSIAVANTFIGVIVKFASMAWNNSDAKFDGTMDVSEQEDGTTMFSLGLDTHPDALKTMDQVLFKVNK